MPSSFAHVDAPTLVGSWPILPALSGGGMASVRPGTLLPRALILGFRREEAIGYDVGSLSFKLTVDGSPFTVSFSAGGPYTLDEVIGFINSPITGVSAVVASRDNGFLRLESTTVGIGSSLLLETDVASSTSPVDVFSELGLFSGTESVSGDLVTAAHVDPGRQVALPGQLSMMTGEDLTNDVVNRSIAQLAINADITYGLVNRKKQAKVTSHQFTVVSPSDYVTPTAVAYTGPNPTPAPLQLHNVAVVLDISGHEVTKKSETILKTEAMGWILEPESEDQIVIFPSSIFFQGVDPKDDVYVRSSDAELGALQDKLIKIIRVNADDEAVVRNLDVDGNRVPITTTGPVTTELVQVATDRVLVNQILDGPGGTRVEQVEQAKHSGSISRIDGNNRLVSVGENFLTAGPTKVVEGDLVVITGHTASFPFSNNGTYRVGSVVDNEVVELLTEDYGPAFLNPTGALGSFELKSDGNFYENATFEFSHELPAGNYNLMFRECSTLGGMLDDVEALTGGPLFFTQETDSRTEKALQGIIGPNGDVDSYLFDDRRINLEQLNFMVTDEHFESGRHSNIRPDTIDMINEVAGVTVTIRASTADATNDKKVSLKNVADFESLEILADGTVLLHDSAPSATTLTLNPVLGLIESRAKTGGPTAEVRALVNSDAQTGSDALLRATNYQFGGSAGKARLELNATGTDDKVEMVLQDNIFGAILAAKFIHSTTAGSLRIEMDDDGSLTPNMQSWGADGIVRFHDEVEIDETGSVAINKIIEAYATFPAALQIARENNRWGVIIDGDDDIQADLLFKCQASAPIGDQNIVQFVQTSGGDFLVRGLDDTFSATGEENYLWFDLAYDRRMGLLMPVSGSFTDVPQDDTTRDRYVQLDGSLVFGDPTVFATTDNGGGAGPGIFPVDASIMGERLIWLDTTSSFMMSSQDGTGRMNMYWNAFADDGSNGWAGDAHRYVRFEEPAVRIHIDTNGDIDFMGAVNAVANGDGIGAASTNDWETMLELKNSASAGQPTAEVPNRLHVTGHQEFGDLGNDVMIENVRAQHPQTMNDSRPYRAYDYSLGTNYVSMPWTPDEFVLYKKWVFILDYTGTVGSIRLRRIDTTTFPDPTVADVSDVVISGIDGIDSLYAAIVVGDHIYIKGHQTGSGRNRWVMAKINVSDPENPYLGGQMGSGAGSTGSTWGWVSDGVYIYLIENTGTLGGTQYIVKINAKVGTDDNPTRDYTTGVTFAHLDNSSGYMPHNGSKGLGFDGTYLYFMHASNNVGHEGVWWARLQPNVRAASAPSLQDEGQITATVPSSSYFLGKIVSDGTHIYYSFNTGSTLHYVYKYWAQSYMSVVSSSGDYATDCAVDDRFFYMAHDYAWWHYKHDMEAAMFVSHATANRTGVSGDYLLLDETWVYGYNASSFGRSLRPR